MNPTTNTDSRTAAALAARQRTSEAAVQRVHHIIARLRRENAPVSVAAVARRANVSRTFLYDNPGARAAIAAAITDTGGRRSQMLAARNNGPEATWRERALNAENALKTAHTEIFTQRAHIGALLGQIRDLQAEWTPDAIQRITSESTNLKQRVRQLSTDNRALDERLKAARSNLRFQDRRVSELEATLTEPSQRPGLVLLTDPSKTTPTGDHAQPKPSITDM
jgi:hypothetical protein